MLSELNESGLGTECLKSGHKLLHFIKKIDVLVLYQEIHLQFRGQGRDTEYWGMELIR